MSSKDLNYTVNHCCVLGLRRLRQLQGQMVQQPHVAHPTGLRTRSRTERKRRILASGCCNSNCWSASRYEYSDHLAARRIICILARDRTAKNPMICLNKHVLSHELPEDQWSSVEFFPALSLEVRWFVIFWGEVRTLLLKNIVNETAAFGITHRG